MPSLKTSKRERERENDPRVALFPDLPCQNAEMPYYFEVIRAETLTEPRADRYLFYDSLNERERVCVCERERMRVRESEGEGEGEGEVERWRWRERRREEIH